MTLLIVIVALGQLNILLALLAGYILGYRHAEKRYKPPLLRWIEDAFRR